MTLFDRIVRKGWLLPDEDPVMLERLKVKLPELFSRAVVVSVDNIFAHLAGLGEDGREDFQSSAMPSQVAPWPVMFAEWRVDPALVDERWFPFGYMMHNRGVRLGWLVTTEIADDGFHAEASLFMYDARAEAVQGPMMMMAMAYDADGHPMPHPDHPATSGGKRSPVALRIFWESWNEDAQGQLQDAAVAAYAMRNLWMPVSMAIGLMHCKNVSVEDAPDTRTRQQRRYDERRGVDPIVFKTLVIDPSIGRKATPAERRAKHDPVTRLHICRGHFSTYTEAKPLFGKYAGTFWIPAHVRGSSDVGEVRKDYRVKAGAA